MNYTTWRSIAEWESRRNRRLSPEIIWMFAPFLHQAETYTPFWITTAAGILETSPLALQVMF